MKYILKENQVESLFKQFMNQYDWKVWNYSDNEISVYTGAPGKRVFYTQVYDDSSDIDETEFTLKINVSFFHTILNFFGDLISPWEIIEWFNDEFNSNCVTFDFYKFEDED